MKKFLQIAKNWAPVLVMVAIILLPLITHAQPRTPADDELTTGRLYDAIRTGVNYLIYLGALVAVAYIVFAGFKYMFAGSESESAGKARTMLWNGLIGLVIIVAAYVIVNSVLAILSDWLHINIRQ